MAKWAESRGSGHGQIIRKPKRGVLNQGAEIKNQGQHQKTLPVLMLEGVMINYQLLTWEDELLFVFEITGGCRKETEGEFAYTQMSSCKLYETLPSFTLDTEIH